MHALLVGVDAIKEAVDLHALLTTRGMTVTSASSPRSALDEFAATKPRVVILDWQAVAAQDPQFCEKVRKLRDGLKTVLLAIVPDDDAVIDAALRAGVSDYITRPLTASIFLTRIALMERWLHARDAHKSSSSTPLVAASYTDLVHLLEQSPDPAGIHRNRMFMYANPALTKALGYDTLTGVSVFDILHPDEHADVEQRLRRIETTGAPAPTRPERYLRRDGKVEVGEVHSFLIQLPDGPAVVTAGRDLTQAELQQAWTRHSERLAAIGKLAASVAHEINNPLTLVMFNLYDLGQMLPALSTNLRQDATAQLELRLKAIEAAVQQMQALTRDLTSYARAEEQPPRAIDVSEIVERAARMITAYARSVAGAAVTIHAVPNATVVASETRLTQVLLNLLLNAVEAVAKAPEGAARRVTARVLPQDGDVIVRISDTGPGISPELRSRVFEPFFSTKPMGQGTGLGLAVARSIIEHMGGSLELRDGDEAGTTTFELRLPREGAGC